MPTNTCSACGYENSSFSADCEFCSKPLTELSREKYTDQNAGQQTSYPSYMSPEFRPPPPPAFDAAGNPVATTSPVSTAPPTCIKCGSRDHVDFEYYRRDYVPPLVYLSLIISPILLVILALVLRKRHELNIPFCVECREKYKQSKTVLNISVIVFLVVFIGGVVASISFNTGWPLLLGILAGIASLVYGVIQRKQNAPVVKKVDGKQIVLTDPVHGDLFYLKN